MKNGTYILFQKCGCLWCDRAYFPQNSANTKVSKTINNRKDIFDYTQSNSDISESNKHNLSSSEENINEEYKKIFKSKKQYERSLPKDEHYYFKDSKGQEWSFTEINGSALYYYFKCTTSKCKAFGKF